MTKRVTDEEAMGTRQPGGRVLSRRQTALEARPDLAAKACPHCGLPLSNHTIRERRNCGR